MRLLCWMIVFILSACIVTALGIAPANKDLTVELGEQQQLIYRIYNTDNSAATLKISINGTLSELIELEDEQLVFTDDEAFKSYTIIVRGMKPGKYKGNIIINGATEVKANLRVRVPGKAPTGNVVANEEGTGISKYILPGVLLLILVANLIFLAGRKISGSVAEKTLKKLKKMNQKQFAKLVDAEQNKIADDLRETIPELAYAVYDITDQDQMIAIIEKYLQKEEQEKNPDELNKEIKDLKHELDTFDFSDFEASVKK